MENKGVVYFLIMGILAGLCVLGIITFIKIAKVIIGGDGYTYSAVAMYCLIYLQI